MSFYQPPTWAIEPKTSLTGWTLTEIKNGVQIAQYKLDKAVTLLGRAEDQVDLVLAHASCSRLHARLAFAREYSTVVLWLRDLGSAHGTFVNKKRLPVQACGKEEKSTKTGSRGVLVYPGDVINFGESTRVYLIDGPEESSKVNVMQARKTQQQQQSTNTSHNPQQQQQQQQKLQSQSINSLLQQIPTSILDVPEDLHDDWQHLQSLKQQWALLQQQQQQQQQNINNSDQIQLQQELQEEITDQSTIFLRKMYPNTGGHVFKSTREAQEYYDDSVEDRADNGNQALNDVVENEQSLTLKFKQVSNTIKYLRRDLNLNNLRLLDLQNEMAAIQASSSDVSDVYFMQNDAHLVQETITKLKAKLADLQAQQKETSKLLHIVNPKLVVDIESGHVGLAKQPNKLQSKVDRNNTNTEKSSTNMSKHIDDRSSKFAASNVQTNNTVSPSQVDNTIKRMSPVTKRPRVSGPTMPPPSSSLSSLISTMASSTSSNLSPPHDSINPTNGQSNMPPPTITSAPNEVNTNDNKQSEKGKRPSDDNTLNEHQDTWKAPKDQDGSGITKLNAKFAGRY